MKLNPKLRLLLFILVILAAIGYRVSEYCNRELYENIYIPTKKEVENNEYYFLPETYMIVNDDGIFFTELGQSSQWDKIINFDNYGYWLE